MHSRRSAFSHPLPLSLREGLAANHLSAVLPSSLRRNIPEGYSHGNDPELPVEVGRWYRATATRGYASSEIQHKETF